MNTIFAMIIIVVIIIIGAATSYAIYTWQHKQVSDLNDKVTSLNEKLATSQKEQCQPSGSQKTEQSCPGSSYTSPKGIVATIYSPIKNAVVSSPVAVIGVIPGNWSSEAQFPVKLTDNAGKVIATATAHVLGNWQTSDPVPFSAQLIYSGSGTGSGFIVLSKDNPSGIAANDDTISVPIRF